MLRNKCTRGRARGFAGVKTNSDAAQNEANTGGCETMSNVQGAGSNESIANSAAEAGNTLASSDGGSEPKDDEEGRGEASTSSSAALDADSEEAEIEFDLSIIRSLEEQFAECTIEEEPSHEGSGEMEVKETKVVVHQDVKEEESPHESSGEMEAEEPKVVVHQDSKEEEPASGDPGTTETPDLSETQTVVSNYIMLKKLPGFGIFIYEVEFDPDDLDLRAKKSLLRGQDAIGIHLYDGTMLFTVAAIPEFCHLLESVEEGSSHHVHLIKLRQCAEFQLTDRTTVNLYKLLLSSIMKKLGLQQMGRNYYDPSKVINLDAEYLDLWPGFIASIREHEKGILLGVDVTHKILRRKTALDVINQVVQRCNDTHVEKYKKIDILHALKGQVVVTRYNPRQYRIDDVDFDASPRKEFVKQDGVTTTVVEYLELKWGIRLSEDELDQPLLLSHNKGELTLLVPSLCILTGLTDAMRRKMYIMKGLCARIHMAPEERRMVLSEFIQKLSMPEIQEELKKWNLELDVTFLPVTSRSLAKEKIQLCTADGRQSGKKEWFVPDDRNDWSEHFKHAGLVEPMSVHKWLLFVPDELKETDCVDFISRMRKTARKLGCKLAEPVKTFWYKCNTKLDVSEFKKNFSENKNGIQLIFYILPRDSGRYAEVKRICTSKWSVASQCLHIRNVGTKLFTSTCQNLIVQICAKLRGQPWTVRIPLPKPMVMGFSTSFCGKTSQYIGSLVASTNSNCTKYFSTIGYYKDRSRASGGIKSGVWKCLEAYAEKNGKELPGQIIFYRDSVSEEELDRIVQSELQQLETGIQTFYKRMGSENNVKFMFIVVTHNQGMRCFLGDSGKWKNPQPGTVISTEVTYPDRNHFIMVSSHANYGSANPTDYNVIHNTMDEFTPENIQDLTYKLCHLYFNSTRPVGVPAPCRYAQKLAQMTSMAVEQEVSMSLAHSLWFL